MIKSSCCAEHYRRGALRCRERAAGTSDFQLRQDYLYVAANFERLADLEEAEDRFRDRHGLLLKPSGGAEGQRWPSGRPAFAQIGPGRSAGGNHSSGKPARCSPTSTVLRRNATNRGLA